MVLSHGTKKALGKGGHHLAPFYPSTHTEIKAFGQNSTNVDAWANHYWIVDL